MKRTKLNDRILPTYTKGEEIFNMAFTYSWSSIWNSCTGTLCDFFGYSS